MSLFTRRRFLITGAASLAAGAFAGCSVLRPGASRAPQSLGPFPRQKGPRYLIPTPHMYRNENQDLAGIVKYDLVIPQPAGFPDECSSTITSIAADGSSVRRIRVPGTIHAIVASPADGLLYLIGVDHPSLLLAVDAETFAPVEMLVRPSGDEPYVFSGHGVRLPGTDYFVTAMNGNEMGHHDILAVRHARTLKLVDRISTHGFEAHEVVLSPDAKLFGVAHYGSYLGSGPYKNVGLGRAYHFAVKPTGFTYPASVNRIHTSSGKLEAILCDRRGGQQGHTVLDARYNAYLANQPPFLESLPHTMENPRFREGVQKEPIFHDEFQVKSYGLGTTVTYDHVHQEVVVPSRYHDEIVVGYPATRTTKSFSLKGLTKQHMPHGLEYHPDGRHYIVSTSDGTLAFERHTHKLVPELTFDGIPLRLHSHFAIG